MDFDLRIKALTSLATSQTEAAIDALRQALQKAQTSLHEDMQYDLLDQSLTVLETIGHRFSDETVAETIRFITNVKTRQITYSDELSSFDSNISRYQNASTLAVRAIEVLLRLRYLETRTIIQTLLNLSIDDEKEIRSAAIDGLRTVSTYNLEVFYGSEKQSGIGAYPQQQILDLLLELDDADLEKFRRAILAICEKLLSPTMEGTRWSSTAVTISRGATPAAAGVTDIRGDTIRLLKRLYVIANGNTEKLSVLGVLNDATRPHHNPVGGDDVATMILRNTQDVLDFYVSLISTADFPIVQKIEAYSYWIFYHAPNEQVKRYALNIEKAIAANDEYQIYKTLIGFEGIFASWEQLRRNNSYWEETDEYRKEQAAKFASSILPENFSVWRTRILAYAKTKSDDLATFPIFYFFLETFAKVQPKLALKLISEDTTKIASFLIPVLRGLWITAEQKAVRQLMDEWILAGQHLYACTKQFLECPTADRELVNRLLERATELNDLDTVALVMPVAASNFGDDAAMIDELFMPALKVLTDRKSAKWIFDQWYRRDVRAVIAKLNESDIDSVLKNLMLLDEIDYHAEEILYVIAERMPEKVLTFLCQRLAEEVEGNRKRKTYDAIPYTLHKLDKPLAAIPKEAIRIVRAQYDGDYGMFIFRGAHLLKTIFPNFSPDFERELLDLVDEGGEKNLEFVVGILRNYEGETFIHNVCKAIVGKVPADSQFRTEVVVALENTGVVSGAYGFAEAYERKKSEMRDWFNDANPVVREFAAWYVESLDKMIIADRQRADEQIALRKQRFDE